ncbi:hypothetical protein SOCEGT47_021040 [Sorangium cellulosum]|uniref:Carrier domain-containing protein n=1 Tax=Sorangium cellulosum TaxID=56 RepID=A0A4P2PYF5_SORCE|nr:non-ribosomal peptide synthetase [Sorangium cellulosum]AUX21618.1 hypothetical protein SOCEGT47_021040 [Sorangium cellulosum]
MNGALLGELDRCATLVDVLRTRAEAQGGALAFRFLTTGDVDGGAEEWTYRDLHLRAMGIAAALQASGGAGERALLLYAPGLDFIAAFMGCVYAGAVAVPTYPPNPAQMERTLPRLRAIARDAGARFVLTTGLIASMAEALRQQAPELAELRWIVTDAIEAGAASAWRAPAISGETLAFLQYTSGSTGNPKGVMVSHENVLANERAILAGFEHDAGSSGVGWLPLFHDMGLIGKVLQPIFVGFPCTLMSPLAFLERPIRWLRAISHFRATTSGGPNFAYDLCARKATREDRAQLDLRSWTVAFNGAEPVRADTLDRFADAFAPCGFRREAFYPCYGLAEATLFVAGGLRAAPPARASVDAGALERGVWRAVDPAAAGARRLVSSGAPRERVVIASPEGGARCAEGQIGEIWVAGPSVAGGYWGRPEETARTFGARLPGDATPYLRTGDLGFLSGGELFVTGRIRDLIILRGRNLYPDDIERTLEAAHPRVRPGCCAAFSIEVGGEERLGVAAELDTRHGSDAAPDVVEALRAAVAREHDVQPHAVLLLRPRTIPKTSSGKIQRHACAKGFRDGTLEVLEASVAAEAQGPAAAGAAGAGAAADPAGDAARVLRLALRAVPAAARPGLLVEVVREELARLARVDVRSVAPGSKLMALGLDSLASVELQARFEELLGVAVPAALLWQASTVEELSRALAAALDAPAPEPAPARGAAPEGEPVELSSHQLRLWFFCRFAPESPLYHVVFGARILGAIDETKLEESLAAVVRRHPALRTVFREIAGEPRQIVLPEVAVPLARARAEGASADEREARLRALAMEWGRRPFALEEGPLLRVCLVSLEERHHVLLFAQHHLVTDGRSIEVLVRDLGASYAGRPDASPGPRLAYADYARAQRAALDRMDAQRAYWKAKLEGLPRLDLGAGRGRAAASPFAGGTVRFSLPSRHVDAALAAARAENATLFVALASLYAALLHRHTGQDDLGIGVVVANRSRPEHQGIVGFFANTVVLRVDLGGRPTYRELLRRVRGAVAEAMERAELPFDEVAREAGAGREGDRGGLIQASFVLESVSEPPSDVDGAPWRPVLWSPDGAVEGTAKFDLGLSVARLPGELAAALEYREGRFVRDEIERMAGHFTVLLGAAAEQPDRPIDELPLLPPEEERFLLEGCNDTAAPVPAGVCFHDLFREQAARTPDRPAVACAGRRLSYAELDRITDRVAHALRARGVGPDRLVGLLAGRDLDFVVLALGAFKAAGAYVPIDPAHPAQRSADILARAGAPLLLVGDAIPAALRDEILAAAGPAAPEALSARDLLAAAPPEPAGAAAPRATPDHLAYVIYTSGSTGAPKGAMVEHRGMLNHLLAKVRSLGLGPSDVVAETAPITFDISVWQLLSPLLAGGACRLVPDEIATDPARLLDAAADDGITVLEIVPSLLRGMLDELASRPAWRPRLDGLRWLVLTGEALAPDLVRRWLALYPRVPVMNAYGPTECSDDVAQHVMVEPPAEDAAYVPIGRPIQNTQLHVLDRQRRPVPIGVAGELYVGGDGVGRGYLHDPERTTAAFLPDPFARTPGARLYRTGDLVRRLPGGELVFLGRIDHQIKLRGFRIELGEIEAVIARSAGIRDVVVVAREDTPGDPRLVAYVVPEGPAARFEPGALRDHLASRLPGYMVPAAIVPLDALPLSANGKVDRKALPAPAWADPAERAARAAPRTGLEQAIAEVWRAVLGLDFVGAHDDFFAIGGHSLSATRVAARLRDLLGVEVAVRSLFEAPTVAALAARLERPAREAAGEGARPGAAPLAPAPRAGDAPLSFAQQRLWFLDQLEPENATYNVPAALRLRGPLDVPALARAITWVVRRHEVLRTTFQAVDGRAVQRFHAAPDAWPLAFLDLTALPAPAREASLLRLASGDAARPFDLARGPLLRASLYRLAPDEHALLVTLHHIASDGWSLGVLAHELTAAYAALAREEEPGLRPLPVQYADYAAWQRRELTEEVQEAEREIWRRRLDGAPPLDLPTDRPRPAARSFRGRTHRFALPEDLVAALRRTSQELGATLFMTLLAAFEVLLHRHSGQEDFCVGTPVAGRGRTELEPLIGLLVNTLVLRARLGGDPTFEELVRRVKADALEAYAHQDLPFEIVVDELAVERDPSRNPLFQVMFALQNAPPPALSLPGVEVSQIALDLEQSRFDLTLFLTESGAGLDGAIEFDLDLFDPETVARLAGHYETILRAAAADPRRRAAELPLLTPRERREVLVAWNATSAPPPPAACLHGLFDAQAERSPGAVAVASDDGELTYGELRRRADALARRLRALGVRPEVRVGLCVRRTLDLVVALWAIFKAGGVHVPLDPGYPSARLALLLEDAGAHLLVTERELSARAPAPPGTRVVLLEELASGLEEPAPPALNGAGAAADAGRPEQAAYLIYTSGSTGRPKAVVIEHRQAVALAWWARRAFSDEELAGVLASTSTCFDLSVFELVVPLCWGGKVVLADNALALPALRRRHEVTLLNTVPSAAAALVAASGIPGSVRTVCLAGEPLRASLARDVLALPHVERLLNLYGPSETTTYSTWSTVTADARPTIGKPIDHTRIYVLDARQQPVPAGVPGEIYIAGAGVARGYLGRDELTAERFVPCPLDEARGARMYRTGDRARWLAGGELEYLGRLDHQVKIRGFRVEPGETEAALAAHPDVREALVLARDDGPSGRWLVAYLLVRRRPIDEQALRAFVAERLPEPFVPSAFVALDAWPLNPNGKIDRKALPPPDRADRPGEARRASGEARRAPATPTERALAGVWGEVLGRDGLGADDDFFSLGGHSLLAVQVVARARRLFGVELPLRAAFDAPTIAALAERIDRARRAQPGAARRPLCPAPRGGDLPLSYAQQRLWFIEELEPGTALYNMPLALVLRGPLDRGALERSLAEVVARHEVLRTRFEARDGLPFQVVDPAPRLELRHVDLSAVPPGERERAARRAAEDEARRPFDLASGLPIRAALLRLSDGEHALLVTVHHIACDGASLPVLFRDLAAFYEAARAGRAPALPPLPVQYADVAVWQRAQADAWRAQLEYWKGQLAGLEPLDLPTDRPRGSAPSYRGDTVPVRLPAPLVEALRALGRREGATLFMLLLAGFAALLRRYTGRPDVAIGSPVAGRTQLEMEPLVGCFINMLVLRVRLDDDPTFVELVRRVRQVTLDAQEHQDVPFEQVVDALEVPRDLGRTPLFQVAFAFQDAPERPRKLGELDVAPLEVDAAVAKFDLMLALEEGDGVVSGGLEFSTDLFDRATVERWRSHLEALLAAVAAEPELRVSDAPLLGPEERRLVLRAFSGAERPSSPEPACAHHLFEAQAKAAPGRTALLFEGAELSYGELDRRANRLAHHLRARGVRRGALVGVCMPRSPNMIVALLAVLKAGGAYVPLDPTYPRERLAFMIEDARPALLIAQPELLPALPAALPPVVRLGEGEPPFPRERADDPAAGALPGDLAYVIYTSGSTGRPKGVLIEHRALSAFAVAQRKLLGVEPGTRVLQFTRLSFDVSVMEIFVPLFAGGAVCLARAEALLPGPGLMDLLRRQRIQVAMLTPSALMAVPPGELPDLRVLCVAGEVCPAELPRRWAKGRRFLNGYGPTEATVLATAAEYGPDVARPTIGRALPNTQVYVLDPRGQPAPVGVPGELHIGGIGLARGYLNRDDLTAARFVRAAFPEAEGARLYRTGDLVRWLPDGQLDFLGRLDEQVKIRGFRIELGEIEAVLASHPGVAEAVVVTREHAPGDVRLAAFFVPRGAPVAVDALRRHLSERLPDYMIPAAIAPVERWPQTPSGKIDRRALAASAPTARAALGQGARVAPRTRAELEICALFEELLGVEGVGATDDFFALGGHSLLAVRLMAEIRGRTGCDLPLTSLFRAPTAEALAALVRERRGAQAGRDSVIVPLVPPAPPGAAGARAPLFFVHPVGGNVLCYAELARALGPDRPIYGVQAFGLETPPRALGSVAEMAEAYCDELRRVQPEGPYLLGGWSMGGVVAFEMARVLERRGRRVAAVVLLDAYLPPFDEPGDELPPLAQFAADLAGLSGADAAAALPAPGGDAADRAWILARLEELGVLPAGTTLDELGALFDVFERNAALLARYAPGAVSARVELFRAEGSPRRDPRPAWARWAPGLRSHVAPGDHYTLLRKPHVEALAGRLREALLDAEADGAAARDDARAARPPG